MILDLPSELGLARAARRRAGGGGVDRFEGEGGDFHETLRRAFLAIAAENPERCVVIDARADEDAVAASIWEAAARRLADALPGPGRAR